MYEIFQVITKYLNKKTLCRLRTVSHEVRDYIKKPKPFKQEKLRRQRYKNIINQYIFFPKKYININKVVRYHTISKIILYKVGSEILYGNLFFFDIDFPLEKKYYSRYSKSFKNKINSCRCKE
jgi:hypothetical protein